MGSYDDITGEELTEETGYYYCICQECNATSPMASTQGQFAGINEWNTRAEIQDTNGKFKSCPFCGSHNIQVVKRPHSSDDKPEDKNIGKYYCECKDCGACSDFYLRELSAITAWNTRAYEQEVKS